MLVHQLGDINTVLLGIGGAKLFAGINRSSSIHSDRHGVTRSGGGGEGGLPYMAGGSLRAGHWAN